MNCSNYNGCSIDLACRDCPISETAPMWAKIGAEMSGLVPDESEYQQIDWIGYTGSA